MPYRDVALRCPRCRVELTRQGTADRWPCARCGGALLGTGELVRELIAVAPDLRPEGGVEDLPTRGRRSAEALPCAMCEEPMAAVFLGGVELDRCYDDELVWFDGGELQRVLAVAREQKAARDQPAIIRVLAAWFG